MSIRMRRSALSARTSRVRSEPFPRIPLSAATLCLTAFGLAAADWGSQRFDSSVVPAGAFDETAHVLTTLLVLWALGPTACERWLVPALAASVAIDIDHIPGQLGADWLTAGTPRPYMHSLLAVATVLLAALLWRRRRNLLVGVALGVAIHFWRDLTEPTGGVSLLWPFSYRAFLLPHLSYVAVLIVIIGIDVYRLRTQSSFAGGETPEANG
jgi:membrane-bound metal-dependent hydrolase YbcI (DUF457 family)